MIDIAAALSYLNDKLWNPERGAYKEALPPIEEHYWFIDNYVAWMVMKKYNPERAAIVQENFSKLEDYPRGYDRWCILEGNTKDFKQSPDVLPDFGRYADLLALQYLYYHYSGNASMGARLYAMLLSQYDGEFITDHATRVGYLEYPPEEYWVLRARPEGHAMYKLALLAICSAHQNKPEIAKQCLDKIGEFQFKEGDEKGGIQTLWWNPEWGTKPEYIVYGSNCETTSLAILAQDTYNQALTFTELMTAASSALAGTTTIYAMGKILKKVTKKR